MSAFPWGKIIKKHTIGSYEIIEYIVDDAFEDCGSISFHYNGNSYYTIEEAMLGILCGDDYNLFPYAYRLLLNKDSSRLMV